MANQSYSMLGSVVDTYNYVMDKRDPRTDGYLLMSSPFPTYVITAAYIYFVKSLGPKLMRNRAPFELKSAIIVYNIIQVAVSVWIVYKGLVHAWATRYSWTCQPVDYSDSPDELMVVQLCWWYYFCKLTEFLDTIFFVLRKKFDQITHLHVIHHSIMPTSVWWGVKFIPSGHGTFFGLLNTFVHIIMYTYYLLAAMGPKYQKYLWWKKHLTTVQMIQFCIVFVHTAQLFFNGCNYPKLAAYIMCLNSVMFLGLFSNFYIQAYIKRRRLPTLQQAETKKGVAVASPVVKKLVKKAIKEDDVDPTTGYKLSDLWNVVCDFVTKASGVCIVDQNGLYGPEKEKKNRKKNL